jgi:hypothetical protein
MNALNDNELTPRSVLTENRRQYKAYCIRSYSRSDQEDRLDSRSSTPVRILRRHRSIQQPRSRAAIDTTLDCHQTRRDRTGRSTSQDTLTCRVSVDLSAPIASDCFKLGTYCQQVVDPYPL